VASCLKLLCSSLTYETMLHAAGKAPAMAALAYHRATGRRAAQPNQRLGYGENFLYMLDAGAKGAYKPNPRLARAIEILFILHAEHEMNCSTAAVRRAHGVIVGHQQQGADGPQSKPDLAFALFTQLPPAASPLRCCVNAHQHHNTGTWPAAAWTCTAR
jgi:Citrate synthase, C-terminal domain